MKRTTLIILFAFLSISLVVLSCTLPIYIVTAPTDEDDGKNITETPIAAIAETPTQASTATFAVTPTVSVSLDGPWTIWQGTNQQMLEINFLQDNFDIVGNAATGDANSIIYEGVISYDGTSASGTWESTDGTSGNFVMYLDSSFSNFSGNMGGGVPFCGNRQNTTKPSPCLQ